MTNRENSLFCKLYTGVNNTAANIACRGELGHFPTLNDIYQRLFKYLDPLNKVPELSLAKQTFLISKDLHLQGNVSY